MIKDYLKYEIKEQFKLEGSKIYSNNASFITNEINDNNSKLIQQVNLSSMQSGKFYFMFYDLAGKSSKMEQFNPLLILDIFDINNIRTVFAVSLNFIPVSIRTVFFNNILNYNLDVIENNLKLELTKQSPLNNINFANIYTLLQSIGFEWSIRKFDYRLISNLYLVDTTILSKFITMSTTKLTRVDDGKLIDIWLKKINEQDSRHKKMISELTNDYSKMENELTKSYNNLDKMADNLTKSLNIINNNFK